MFKGSKLSVVMHTPQIALLTFDAPDASVNVFDRTTVAEFTQALDVLEADQGVAGLIINSGKKSFMVGADINEFGAVFAAGGEGIAQHLQTNIVNFNRLEELPFPVVVAINEIAVGGALELSLAADFRVASTGSRLGLPETKLGIIPGWGGTVRLPRLVGIDTAIEWIASGKQYDAEEALRVQVIDALVTTDQLLPAALALVTEAIEGRYDYRERRHLKTTPMVMNAIEAGLAFASAKAFVAASAGKHYPAPVAAIDAMQKSVTQNRDQALQTETEFFVKVAATDTAQALVGVFVSDQLLMKKARHWREKDSGKISQAAVLGAGIMGGGIACQSALMGVPIIMKDIQQQGLDLGMDEAKKRLLSRLDRNRLQASELADALIRIQPTLHYDVFSGVDMAVEAVVENIKVKKAVLSEVEKHLPDEAVLTSNTSTISISELATALDRPHNFCGMHFFNPVHAMPLVEVIRGEKTADSAIARTLAYALALGKKPVVVNDCPGFLVNRVLFPYFQAFALLVRDGADIAQVDKTMERWGWPMGPAYLLDVVGLDTAVHAEQVMADAFPDRMRRDFTSALEVLYEAGRLGQKNKQGFYDYSYDKKGRLQKNPSADAQQLLASCSGEARSFSDDEIVMRMMLPMITELVRCIEENIVETVAEADMAMVYGTGFPPFRGGVFRWIDSVGAQTVCAAAETYQSLGALYVPPALLQEKAQAGETFYC